MIKTHVIKSEKEPEDSKIIPGKMSQLIETVKYKQASPIVINVAEIELDIFKHCLGFFLGIFLPCNKIPMLIQYYTQGQTRHIH